MTSSSNHQSFVSKTRVSQSLRNDRCQNILYKAVLEHFKELDSIAALLLASKSFQNSSFGANFLVNFVVDGDSIWLLDSVLSPSSCFSLQFAPSFHVRRPWMHSEKINRGITNFIGELVETKYLRLSLRSLTFVRATNEDRSSFFGSSTSNEWPQLQDSTLENWKLDDAVLKTISKNVLQLRTVNLPRNPGITDVGLEYIVTLSRITSLDLSGCENITDAGMEHISKLSGLISLCLSNCHRITDASLDLISTFSGLTSLDLSNCHTLSDASLRHIAKLDGITSLSLCRCRSITDPTLDHLITNLSDITSLNLEGCSSITSAGLERISQLSRITYLNLNGCTGVTDAILERVSTLPRITSLNLNGCTMITDAGLQHLVKLSHITALDLSGCENITDAGLDSIAKLVGLTSFNILFCAKISNEALDELRSALPLCHIRGRGAF